MIMERVNRILENSVFQTSLAEIEALEDDRIFCRHNIEHFLNVARIAWILNLEEDAGLEKELVYAAALLHDIGKHCQYREGIPHEQASALAAPEILKDCGFSDKEISKIVRAVASHRYGPGEDGSVLDNILYRADKLSRSCFSCSAAEECNWGRRGKKRNQSLLV